MHLSSTFCVQDADDRCVLQFTLHNAAGCALHRRASRVIHRSELCVAWTGPCDMFCVRPGPRDRQRRRGAGPSPGPGFGCRARALPSVKSIRQIQRESARPRVKRNAVEAASQRRGGPATLLPCDGGRRPSGSLRANRETAADATAARLYRPTSLRAVRRRREAGQPYAPRDSRCLWRASARPPVRQIHPSNPKGGRAPAVQNTCRRDGELSTRRPRDAPAVRRRREALGLFTR